MRSHFLRTVTLGALTSMLLSGCLLSSAVDRTYLGFNESPPRCPDRKVTGLALLPFATAADVLFLPVEALVVIFGGDNYSARQKDRNPSGARTQENALNPCSTIE